MRAFPRIVVGRYQSAWYVQILSYRTFFFSVLLPLTVFPIFPSLFKAHGMSKLFIAYQRLGDKDRRRSACVELFYIDLAQTIAYFI